MAGGRRQLRLVRAAAANGRREVAARRMDRRGNARQQHVQCEGVGHDKRHAAAPKGRAQGPVPGTAAARSQMPGPNQGASDAVCCAMTTMRGNRASVTRRTRDHVFWRRRKGPILAAKRAGVTVNKFHRVYNRPDSNAARDEGRNA